VPDQRAKIDQQIEIELNHDTETQRQIKLNSIEAVVATSARKKEGRR